MERYPAPGTIQAPVQAELAAVAHVLRAIGRDDGRVLRQLVAGLLHDANDLLRPAIACLMARALARGDDDRGGHPILQFAAAVQLVYVAARTHQAPATPGAPRDHLAVLVGDYLYAQAAVLTAGLRHLTVMAMVSEAIMSSCRWAAGDDARDADYASPHGAPIGGLFELSAVGPAILLGQEPRARTLAAYGRALDGLWQGTGDAACRARLSDRALAAIETIPPGTARTALRDAVAYIAAMAQPAARSAPRGSTSGASDDL